jgi:hypothetical protein
MMDHWKWYYLHRRFANYMQDEIRSCVYDEHVRNWICFDVQGFKERALNDNGGVDKVLNLHGIKSYGL